MHLHNQIFIIFEYTDFFTLVEGVYGEMKRPKIAPNERWVPGECEGGNSDPQNIFYT